MVTRGRSALTRALDSGRVTQKQIGDATGAAQSTVSGWKTGLYRPDAFQREVLDRLLGIAPGAWITADERDRLKKLRRIGRARRAVHGPSVQRLTGARQMRARSAGDA